MYEVLFLIEVNEQQEWTTIGEYVAKILSDIFFKSPVTDTWNYKNSDVLNEEWGEPLNIYDGTIREINQILVEYGLDPIPVEQVDGGNAVYEQDTGIPQDFLPTDDFIPNVQSAHFEKHTLDSDQRTSTIEELTTCIKKYPKENVRLT